MVYLNLKIFSFYNFYTHRYGKTFELYFASSNSNIERLSFGLSYQPHDSLGITQVDIPLTKKTWELASSFWKTNQNNCLIDSANMVGYLRIQNVNVKTAFGLNLTRQLETPRMTHPQIDAWSSTPLQKWNWTYEGNSHLNDFNCHVSVSKSLYQKKTYGQNWINSILENAKQPSFDDWLFYTPEIKFPSKLVPFIPSPYIAFMGFWGIWLHCLIMLSDRVFYEHEIFFATQENLPAFQHLPEEIRQAYQIKKQKSLDYIQGTKDPLFGGSLNGIYLTRTHLYKAIVSLVLKKVSRFTQLGQLKGTSLETFKYFFECELYSVIQNYLKTRDKYLSWGNKLLYLFFYMNFFHLAHLLGIYKIGYTFFVLAKSKPFLVLKYHLENCLINVDLITKIVMDFLLKQEIYFEVFKKVDIYGTNIVWLLICIFFNLTVVGSFTSFFLMFVKKIQLQIFKNKNLIFSEALGSHHNYTNSSAFLDKTDESGCEKVVNSDFELLSILNKEAWQPYQRFCTFLEKQKDSNDSNESEESKNFNDLNYRVFCYDNHGFPLFVAGDFYYAYDD